jgi:hypothetical protein
MINPLKSRSKCSLLFLTALLTACSETQAPAPAGINVSPPAMLLNTQRVVEDQLRPVVVLSDGQTVNMSRSLDNGWTGTTTVVSNQSYEINITWIERYLDTDLALANLNQQFSVGTDAHVLTIEQSSYNTNLDFDSDGATNLQERLNDSDPFNAEDGNGVTTGSDTDDDDDDENDDDNDDMDTGNDTGGTSNATVLIPVIDSDDAPEIDGQITIINNRIAGAWAKAINNDINGTPLAIDNLMIDFNADHDDDLILRRWAAMHDGDYLYILVVSDDTGLRFSDSERTWHDDSLELYIDGDNSKSPTYGDDDDIQVIIPLQRLNSASNNDSEDGRFIFGAGSNSASINIDFATGIGVGPDGLRVSRWEQDVYEMRIAIDSAGIAVGRAFGLELQINDDDDGDERDGKWGWFHPSRTDENTDFTHLNPSIMGTVILQ